MHKRGFSISAILIAAVALTALAPVAHAQNPAAPPLPGPKRTFEIKSGKFLLDGRPFQIVSGEMHYARIPQQYWRQRLKMARACGLNTIATYVFWNVHEPEPGKFNFKGDADLAKFIRTAKEEGLYVILRPGPYVCAEWDFGGFPYWLLNVKGMKIRSQDSAYMGYVRRFFDQLYHHVGPLQLSRGGNILMVQVENEYGSYGSDKIYMGMVRDGLVSAGFTQPLFMCDGGSQLASDYLPGLFPGENGGSGPDIKKNIDKYYPGGPYFVPEYYPGWLDHWGEEMSRVGEAGVVRSTERMLNGGVSFNYYMFHGGTNFGFYNGANFGSGFEPDITSYDYDAPLDEAGRATSKYQVIRTAIARYLGPGIKLPEPPVPPAAVTVAPFELTKSGSLAGVLPTPILSDSIKSMEAIGQDYGYILYRTHIRGPVDDYLLIKEVRDYAVVMIDGKRIGIIDRRHASPAPHIVTTETDAVLDILVENEGRINYGRELVNNRKGITDSVKLGPASLKGWEIYSLPFRSVSKLKFDGHETGGPTLRGGKFDLENTGDTYLDMRGWSKGVAFVNGHNLGRFWGIGPQQTLYVPGPWLKKGENTVVILDMLPNGHTSIAGIAEPILDSLQK